jgi:hypothetical protein
MYVSKRGLHCVWAPFEPREILRIGLRKHHFVPFLMYLKDISNNFYGIWRALLGNIYVWASPRCATGYENILR